MLTPASRRLVTPHSTTVFALVDCNNFFVSCERLFRPDLEGQPAIVLSSNDGCVVARSNEAKALGIPMGAPAFKCKDTITRHNIRTFSANFELYGDISQRLTSLLTRVTPHIEVYSVDESFIDLSELDIPDLTAWGRQLRAKILQDTGLPVSVGIAPTKTLAKLAAGYAKRHDELAGAACFVPSPSDVLRPDILGGQAGPLGQPSEELGRALTSTPVQDIWGVGWRLAPKLKAEGIHTADDLRHMQPAWARQLMGKHGAQMVAELNGLSCLPLEQGRGAHKTIMRGRTLGQETFQLEPLESAVVSLAARAAFGARRDDRLVHSASLILNTNRHKPGYQRLSRNVRFVMPTADTGVIAAALVDALRAIYNPRMGVYRVNISFDELVPASGLKLDLFGDVIPTEHDRQQARMATVDALNTRFGRGHVIYAAERLNQSWQPHRGARSPHYTTDWADLPLATLQPETT